MRKLSAAVLLLVLSLSLSPITARAGGGRTTTCAAPLAEWPTAAPEDVDLDAEALTAALEYARPRMTQEIAVYRHGYLVDARRWFAGEDEMFEGWSMSKSVTAMATGRAATLGLLHVNDKVGEYVPEADAEHAEIRIRDLLTMTSGLHWNLYRDYNIAMADRVEDALSLPIDHKPGTFFEYGQSPVALLAKVVGNAAGVDFQDFVQAELLGPIGIQRDEWTWLRDSAGNSEGYRGFNTTVDNFAKLGYLMLHGGCWDGEAILDPRFVRAALTPSKTNPGYGYLFWLNRGESHINPTVYSRDERDHRHVESAPHDMYFMAGIQHQRVWVVPSLDLIVVRVGGSGDRQADTRSTVFTAASGEFEHEFFRLLMKAVTDVNVPDPGPYEFPDPVPHLDPNYGILKSTTEPNDMIEGFGRP